MSNYYLCNRHLAVWRLLHEAERYEEDIERGEIRATNILNGGGERIRLETANGNIYIRELIDRQ